MKTLFGVRRALLRVTASPGGVWLVLGTQLVGIAIYANQTIIWGDPEKWQLGTALVPWTET
ncbi:uncharacterized protein LOC143023842 isoform X2 [Oratosquilla oratoria]|uniref:uncharacterized protein LOC143023842 isoform X2 n=1 Tax=Oratosquilla oratoria TaxID=337810 RepID=UPI003F7714A7